MTKTRREDEEEGWEGPRRTSVAKPAEERADMSWVKEASASAVSEERGEGMLDFGGEQGGCGSWFRGKGKEEGRTCCRDVVVDYIVDAGESFSF